MQWKVISKMMQQINTDNYGVLKMGNHDHHFN